jgi:AraC-like DNA-binding protein
MRCLNFVLEGLEQYEINGRLMTVQAGEFILVEAGTTARAILPQRQVTRGLCIYLPDPESDRRPSPLGDAFQLATADGALSRQLHAVARFLTEQPSRGSAVAGRVVRDASTGLDQLVAELTPRLMRIDAARPRTRRELLEKAERARRYLHDHPYQAVGLSELSEAAAMSPFHLTRVFSAVFGQAPATYHRRIRIELAERELEKGNMSIQEVAQRFGFAEASSFSRAFHRSRGKRPRQACELNS